MSSYPHTCRRMSRSQMICSSYSMYTRVHCSGMDNIQSNISKIICMKTWSWNDTLYSVYSDIILNDYSQWRGTLWRSWLRHCATSRQVAGSIPDGVIGIFHWHNPSGRTMALGLTQPLTQMSSRNISWGLRRPVRRVDNLTTFMCRLSWNLGASTSWKPQGLSTPVIGLLLLTIKV